MRVSMVNLSGHILELDVEPIVSVQQLQCLAQGLHPNCRHVKLVLSGQVLINCIEFELHFIMSIGFSCASIIWLLE